MRGFPKIAPSLAVALVTALAGCGDSDGGTDAGPPAPAPADAAARDTAPPTVWTPRDTGPPPSLDAGGYEGRECNLLLDLLNDAPKPRCVNDTVGCLAACGDGEEGCEDACYAADPTPPADGIDCNGCVTGLFFDCLVEQGCDRETYGFLCCFEDQCLEQADGCAETMCGDHLMGIFNCAISNTSAQACLNPATNAAACFPSDDDAGT